MRFAKFPEWGVSCGVWLGVVWGIVLGICVGGDLYMVLGTSDKGVLGVKSGP